jgi:hypothetical protein
MVLENVNAAGRLIKSLDWHGLKKTSPMSLTSRDWAVQIATISDKSMNR